MTGRVDPGDAEETTNPAAFAQGYRLRNPSLDQLAEAIDAAFDYRGDVALRLASGEEVVGYLFNRHPHESDPHLEIFPKNADSRRSIRYRDIVELHFSGRDPASGRSWETWVKNYEAKKAARARGEDVGRIGIDGPSLDDEE